MSGRIVVSVIGAGGKMGTRVTNNLARHADRFELHLCENSPPGVASIRARGFATEAPEAIVPKSDVTVLAIPDVLIKKISVGIVELMRPGSTMIILDPAAAVARELALRDDCTFAVTHPCHPSWWLDQDTPEARQDHFGGISAKQDIVMAKIQGDDARFAEARAVSEVMFAPVHASYVVTIRQMAFLEPTLVETLGATVIQAMAETVDEAERRGIPRAAAASFLTGHINILSAAFLGKLGNVQVSDACKVAMGIGRRMVLRDDWKRIWEDDVLDRCIATMLHPDKPQI